MLLVFICLSGCGLQDKTTLKLGHSLDQRHAVHKALVYMGQRLEHYSDGRMKLDIYPGGQLGSERELIELLQIGSLAMTKVSASPMEGFVPEMKVFSLPYLFRDNHHYWRVLESDIGKSLLLSGESFRLRGLAYYDAGSRSFYTTSKPVSKPADLTGLKIRVQKSQTSVQMVEALGGSATPISWGELYTALQQGVADGAENNPPSFYNSRHYEVCKYLTLDEHTSVPDILLISKPIWDRLSEQEQHWLQKAVNDSVSYQRDLWKKDTEEALVAVEKAGVTVVRPDKLLFQEASRKIYLSINDDNLKSIIQRIQQI